MTGCHPPESSSYMSQSTGQVDKADSSWVQRMQAMVPL